MLEDAFGRPPCVWAKVQDGVGDVRDRVVFVRVVPDFLALVDAAGSVAEVGGLG
jgi:hypothetical protein